VGCRTEHEPWIGHAGVGVGESESDGRLEDDRVGAKVWIGVSGQHIGFYEVEGDVVEFGPLAGELQSPRIDVVAHDLVGLRAEGDGLQQRCGDSACRVVESAAGSRGCQLR